MCASYLINVIRARENPVITYPISGRGTVLPSFLFSPHSTHALTPEPSFHDSHSARLTGGSHWSQALTAATAPLDHCRATDRRRRRRCRRHAVPLSRPPPAAAQPARAASGAVWRAVWRAAGGRSGGRIGALAAAESGDDAAQAVRRVGDSRDGGGGGGGGGWKTRLRRV